MTKRLLPLAIATLLPLSVFASGERHHDNGGDTQTTNNIVNKKTVPIGPIIFGTITIGTTIYCAIQRWGYNDPCIGSGKAVTMTDEDDKVAPTFSTKPLYEMEIIRK